MEFKFVNIRTVIGGFSQEEVFCPLFRERRGVLDALTPLFRVRRPLFHVHQRD